jgi:predicted  nucleic acid-binding Zn-ribbon protein
LLSGEPELDSSPITPATPGAGAVSERSRIDALEAELSTLKSEFRALRQELEDFKKSFG